MAKKNLICQYSENLKAKPITACEKMSIFEAVVDLPAVGTLSLSRRAP